MLQTRITVQPLYSPPHPPLPQIIYNQPTYSNIFVLLLLIDDMILYTSSNNVPPFCTWNGHQKLSIYQLLLIFNVDIPPHGINLLLIVTLLSNIPPMSVPNFIHYDILLLIQVQISLLWHLFLRHICRYIHFTTRTIKYRQMYPFSKHARFSNLRIPKSSQQFTLLFLGIMI